MARVTVLCGGTGAAELLPALEEVFGSLNIVINGYDDGFSTGRLRAALGLLGPSDFGKVIAALVRPSLPKVSEFLNTRVTLEPNTSWSAQLGKLVLSSGGPPQAIIRFLEWIDLTQSVLSSQQRSSVCSDDIAARNLIVAGAFIDGAGVQAGLDCLSETLRLRSRIVNASETRAWLVGMRRNGQFLPTEAAISAVEDETVIRSIHLLAGPTFRATSRLEPDSIPRLHATAAPEAVRAVAQAPALIYAPGTFFSSIVPTVSILKSAISSVEISKVAISNLTRENRTDDQFARWMSTCYLSGEGFGGAWSIPDQRDPGGENATSRSLVTDVIVNSHTASARWLDGIRFRYAPVRKASLQRHLVRELLSVIEEALG